MKLRCPSCGAGYSLDVAVQARMAREALVAAMRLPSAIAPQVISYLTLFRPAKSALSFDRVEKLLAGLVEEIEAGTVKRNGMSYPASLDVWAQGLDTVLQARTDGRLRLPLKSHGYLYEVVAGLADKAAGEEERKRHEDLAVRRDTSPDRKPSSAAPNAALDEFGLDRNSSLYAEMRAEAEQAKSGVQKSGTG